MLAFSYDGDLLTGIQYSGQLNATISQRYNSDFVIDQMSYAGATTSYGYDNDLLLIQANGFAISRNARHGLPEAVTASGYQQQRSYNAYGEPQNVSTRVAGNTAYSYSLTYNDLGLIVGKTETLHDGSSHQYVYSYDDNRRLKSVMKNGVLVESYAYDHNGNRTSQTNTARGIAGQTASYNIADQLTQDGNVTYQYDADGYLTRKTDGSDITYYQYSRQGRLLSVQTPTGLVEYRHNALGNRVAKLVNGQITEKYLWLDKTTLLATYDGNNNLKQRFEYTLGHTPTSFTQNGNRYYIVTDHLGSPRAISDASGNIVKAVSYDSYGNVLSDTNPGFAIPFGFAGGLQDGDTGLIRFGFRDYVPGIGRWTARDPIGLDGGDNIYGYVDGNPVNMVDPTGEFGVAGALIGGTANALGAYFTGGSGGDVAKAFAVGAVTGFFTGGLSGVAGSAGKWAAAGAISGAATGGATSYVTGGDAGDVLVAMILGASAGTISGVGGNNVAFNNAMALLQKKIANKGWSRSDLAGDLAAAIAALWITVGVDQLNKLLDEIIKDQKCK